MTTARIKATLDLTKETALKRIQAATIQLKKVSKLQDELTLNMCVFNQKAFSLVEKSWISQQDMETFERQKSGYEQSEQSKDLVLQENSQLAGEKRKEAEMSIIFLNRTMSSNPNDPDNHLIKQTISAYRNAVCELLGSEAETAAHAFTEDKSIPTETPKDFHTELLTAANKFCGTKYPEFMQALNAKQYALALRKAAAVASLPLIKMLSNYIETLNIDVNETSATSKNTALDWLEKSKADSKVKEAVRSMLLQYGAKSGLNQVNDESETDQKNRTRRSSK